MGKSRKGLFITAGIAVAITIAALLLYLGFQRSGTAHASSAPELFSSLPPGAPTLVYLDLAAVRASSFYQHRPDKSAIAVPSQDYAEFVRSTGFDFEKDLDRVAIASWPAAGDQPRKNVVIADGRFDRAKISDYAKRKGKVDRQQGRDVFVFSGEDQMKSQSESLTFLDDHRIAIVAGTSIAPLLNVPAATGSDPAREHAAHVDGAAMFVVTRVPPIPDNAGGGGAQAAQLAALARSVEWITLAARPEGDNVRVSLEGECDNDTDARQLQAALELLRMFGRAGLDSPKTRQSMDPNGLATLQTLLNSAEITQSAQRVRILLEVTPDVFKLGPPGKAKQQQ